MLCPPICTHVASNSAYNLVKWIRFSNYAYLKPCGCWTTICGSQKIWKVKISWFKIIMKGQICKFSAFKTGHWQVVSYGRWKYTLLEEKGKGKWSVIKCCEGGMVFWLAGLKTQYSPLREQTLQWFSQCCSENMVHWWQHWYNMWGKYGYGNFGKRPISR